jgi:hypothetical protein
LKYETIPDIALVLRSLKERWPLTAAKRKATLNKMVDLVLAPDTRDTIRVRAFDVLVYASNSDVNAVKVLAELLTAAKLPGPPPSEEKVSIDELRLGLTRLLAGAEEATPVRSPPADEPPGDPLAGAVEIYDLPGPVAE